MQEITPRRLRSICLSPHRILWRMILKHSMSTPYFVIWAIPVAQRDMFRLILTAHSRLLQIATSMCNLDSISMVSTHKHLIPTRSICIHGWSQFWLGQCMWKQKIEINYCVKVLLCWILFRSLWTRSNPNHLFTFVHHINRRLKTAVALATTLGCR